MSVLKEENYSSDLIFLDPKKTQFFVQDGDALRMTLMGNRTYLRVTAALSYPLSDPFHFIGIREADGPEIGMIHDIRELDHDSRAVLEEELRKRYFTPVIRRFISIRQEFGAVYFDVDTDKGSRQFVVRGLRESIAEINLHRYLITDVDGNRFELPDASQLDQKSLILWERIV